MNKFTTPTFVEVNGGYEIVCAENHFTEGKLTGFTNHRFGVTTRDGDVFFLSVTGKSVSVNTLAGYRDALELELPKLREVCLPLANAACSIIQYL